MCRLIDIVKTVKVSSNRKERRKEKDKNTNSACNKQTMIHIKVMNIVYQVALLSYLLRLTL